MKLPSGRAILPIVLTLVFFVVPLSVTPQAPTKDEPATKSSPGGTSARARSAATQDFPATSFLSRFARICASETSFYTALGALALGLLLCPLDAWGYRPFVSTDAAVADPQEMESELGYFSLERNKDDNTFRIPSLVLNYGVLENWEVVGEFKLEEGGHDVNIVDPGLSLKACSVRACCRGRTDSGSPSRRDCFCPHRSEENEGSASKGLVLLAVGSRGSPITSMSGEVCNERTPNHSASGE